MEETVHAHECSECGGIIIKRLLITLEYQGAIYRFCSAHCIVGNEVARSIYYAETAQTVKKNLGFKE